MGSSFSAWTKSACVCLDFNTKLTRHSKPVQGTTMKNSRLQSLHQPRRINYNSSLFVNKNYNSSLQNVSHCYPSFILFFALIMSNLRLNIVINLNVKESTTFQILYKIYIYEQKGYARLDITYLLLYSGLGCDLQHRRHSNLLFASSKRRGIAKDDISAICLLFHPSSSSQQTNPWSLNILV